MRKHHITCVTATHMCHFQQDENTDAAAIVVASTSHMHIANYVPIKRWRCCVPYPSTSLAALATSNSAASLPRAADDQYQPRQINAANAHMQWQAVVSWQDQADLATCVIRAMIGGACILAYIQSWESHITGRSSFRHKRAQRSSFVCSNCKHTSRQCGGFYAYRAFTLQTNMQVSKSTRLTPRPHRGKVRTYIHVSKCASPAQNNSTEDEEANRALALYSQWRAKPRRIFMGVQQHFL
jgi:hypothetical protein